MRKLAALVLIFVPICLLASNENSMFATIKTLAAKGDYAQLEKTSSEFLKKFPSSRHAVDVSIILAENEKNPEEAVRKYRAIIAKYKNYGKLDLLYLRICEIYHLQSDWKSLAKEALTALGSFPKSAYTGDFQLFYCAAEASLYRYDQSLRFANDVIKHENNKNKAAQAALFSAQAERARTGYSRSYGHMLRELVIEYPQHGINPTALLLLGDFYEKTNSLGKAVGAYSSLAEKYPRSPEYAMMRTRLNSLRSKGVKIDRNILDRNTIERTQKFDLTYRDEQEKSKNQAHYSVAIGPLDTEKRAAEIHRVLKNFGTVKTIRRKEGFFHYIGNFASVQQALGLRVRIAEEYGINGSIVRFAGDENQRYIYREEK
ncbi:MAG: hypothetical protein FWG92_07770 [Leptospirales bacterium]|nr:hypothetical protein [Leptospirales bacterium]